jgi:hypothetical protein
MVKVKKDDKVYLIHFGAKGYHDYTTFPAEERDKKKEAYLKRHAKNENWNDVLTAGYWSRWVSWNLPTVGASLNYIIKRDKLNLEAF